MKFSCSLIGQDSLLIECGKYLIEKEHQIKLVITPTPAIQNWCEEHSIAWVKTMKEPPAKQAYSVDYLFSIVNGTILSKEELTIARIASINYHDALLPKYAGVNATTWSLLNGEREHGITWHLISEGIDKGDIVYQHSFQVTENETALTLNLRCFEEAVKGFVQIVNQIETNSLKTKQQSNEGRSYYGINQALLNLGFINWQTDDALSIHRCYRALNLGNYSNNVGTLKLYLNNDYLCVAEAEVETDKEIECSATAGQILAINSNGILVSTISKPIWLKKLISKAGKLVSYKELIEFYGLQLETLLPQIELSFIDEHIHRYKKCLSKEKYWIEKLTQATEHIFFTEQMVDTGSELQLFAAIDLKHYLKEPSQAAENVLLAAVLLYLYRINNYENYTVYCQYTQQAYKNTSLFSDLLPLSTEEFNSEMTNTELLNCVETILLKMSNAGTFLNDITLRQPRLASLNSNTKKYLITFGGSGQLQINSNRSLLHFDIDHNKQLLKIFHRININFQGANAVSLLQNMEQHLINIFHEIWNHPEKRIHQFSFLSAQEYSRLLSWGVGEYRPLPSNTITTIFEQRALFTPDKTIIFDVDKQITYYQLWLEAENVTAYLLLNHIQPMTKITICGFKGSKFLAVVLGILKSGCICKLINDKNPNKNPILLIDYQSDISKSVSSEELFSEKISKVISNEDKSLPKQACIELADDNYLFNQKQLVNYFHWLAASCDFNEGSTIAIHKNLTINHLLLHGLAALFAGATIDFRNKFGHAISHISFNTKDLVGYLETFKLTQNLYKIPNLLLTEKVPSEDIIQQLQTLSPNSRLMVIDDL